MHFRSFHLIFDVFKNKYFLPPNFSTQFWRGGATKTLKNICNGVKSHWNYLEIFSVYLFSKKFLTTELDNVCHYLTLRNSIRFRKSTLYFCLRWNFFHASPVPNEANLHLLCPYYKSISFHKNLRAGNTKCVFINFNLEKDFPDRLCVFDKVVNYW